MIDQIADINLRKEARGYFSHGEYSVHSNPWVDVLGAMAGLSASEIDEDWVI
ncbi:hypothetical protein [Ensifer adhaerens]|uniref:hypothetical protein n=1 Tax=Ensifer adhaerens TaxID=106592 RepID=UPI0015C3D42B|nr:hypothetical protein [Ensifer adhaerens]